MASRVKRIVPGLLLTTFVCAVGLFVYAFVHGVLPMQEFRAEHNATKAVFDEIERAPPSGYPEKSWHNSVGFVWSVYMNVFYAPQDGTMPQMRQFRVDVERHLETVDVVDVSTLRWVMQRMKAFEIRVEYMQRMNVQFDEEHGLSVPEV